MSDTPEVTICPTCQGAGTVTVDSPDGLTGALCPTCDGLGDTAGPLEIVNTTPPPGTCICIKGIELLEDEWHLTFEGNPQCPQHGADIRAMADAGGPLHLSITEDENNGQ